MSKENKILGFTVIDNETGKETDPCEVAQEEWGCDLMYCDIEGFALLESGSLVLLDECGNYAYCPSDRFTVVFEEERKQSEGAWIEHYSFGAWHYDCPFCDDGFGTSERDTTPPNFCSNCGAKLTGAKMKGEHDG